MSLKHKLYFIKLRWINIAIVILVILGLYQVISYSFALSQKKTNEVDRIDMLSNISDSFNNFGVNIISKSNTQNLVFQSQVDIQVELTISASVEDLHLEWALEQDVNITQSDLPTEPISFEEAQESPIMYDAKIQITGERPHVIVQAYTLGDQGEKIGESGEIYFNSNNGTDFLPNIISGDEIKIRIDPSKIIR